MKVAVYVHLLSDGTGVPHQTKYTLLSVIYGICFQTFHIVISTPKIIRQAYHKLCAYDMTWDIHATVCDA